MIRSKGSEDFRLPIERLKGSKWYETYTSEWKVWEDFSLPRRRWKEVDKWKTYLRMKEIWEDFSLPKEGERKWKMNEFLRMKEVWEALQSPIRMKGKEVKSWSWFLLYRNPKWVCEARWIRKWCTQQWTLLSS
jgi:hypothetical protein